MPDNHQKKTITASKPSDAAAALKRYYKKKTVQDKQSSTVDVSKSSDADAASKRKNKKKAIEDKQSSTADVSKLSDADAVTKGNNNYDEELQYPDFLHIQMIPLIFLVMIVQYILINLILPQRIQVVEVVVEVNQERKVDLI